jgi:hypothetical protein
MLVSCIGGCSIASTIIYPSVVGLRATMASCSLITIFSLVTEVTCIVTHQHMIRSLSGMLYSCQQAQDRARNLLVLQRIMHHKSICAVLNTRKSQPLSSVKYSQATNVGFREILSLYGTVSLGCTGQFEIPYGSSCLVRVDCNGGILKSGRIPC